MSEQSAENSPPAGSGPIITFHGTVHGFTYSASPQGNLIMSCDTRCANCCLQNVRRGNGTNRGASPTVNQASDASSSSSPRSTSTVYYECGGEDTPTTPGDRRSPSGDPTCGGLETSDAK